MAIEYFCCYHSYRRRCEKLTDQELGRLFRALMEYSETGEMQELTGRESIAFDFIADDIDRAKVTYQDRCRLNAENGKKGGRPKTERFLEEPNGFSENPPKPNKSEKSQSKGKSKGKGEGESKGENPPLPPLQWAGEELQSAFSDWLVYKAERKDDYTPTGLRNLESEVRNNALKYGEMAVAELIRQCMASGWKGIIFERLQKRDELPKKTGGGNVFMEMLEEERA